MIYSKINEYNIKEANKDHDKASEGIIKLQKPISREHIKYISKIQAIILKIF